MSSVYLAQARYLLIQKMAIIVIHLADELDEQVCDLHTFDFKASTCLLRTLRRTLREQMADQRTVSPTDFSQYEGMNGSSSLASSSFR